ncbi:MAG: very short patch repair endonuclease [Opitutaceae bacterium]
MADHVAPSVRSRIMAAVRSRDTGPELALRQALHRLGYRYRVNVRALPGSPDLVFPSRRKVVFVHGCFWHGHSCRWGRAPKSRREFWFAKRAGNRRRDRRNLAELRQLGWRALVVWQCELKRPGPAIRRAIRFLGPSKR